ncbi:DUF6894 family protein [Methylobacterium nigriterrae]|uniref:DUF6894 family protein n=1 Tax=Methylobacterium nigriterrae TaxID=3127512 RepID=UPI0030140E4F
MLKRFYFDLVNRDSLIPDTDGIEAADLAEALAQAELALAEMKESGEADSFGCGWELLVRDEAGSVLRKLPIA